MLILNPWQKMAKLKKKDTWPTLKSAVGSSKTVLSVFSKTFCD